MLVLHGFSTVRLDKVYAAAEASPSISPPLSSPSPPPSPPSPPPRPTEDFPDHETFDHGFNDDFAKLMEELRIQDELATRSMQTLNTVHDNLTGGLQTLKNDIDEDFGQLMKDLQIQLEQCTHLFSELLSPSEVVFVGLVPAEEPAYMVWNEEAMEWQLPNHVYQGMHGWS